METILNGTLGGLVAGIATALGAVPVLIGKTLSQRASDTLLGFAAGVMLSASYFSLILPGIDIATEQYGSTLIASLIAGLGIALGAAFVAWLNSSLPHEHFITGQEGADTAAMGRIWLFVIAITIHNFPEGMSIGVAFGDGTTSVVIVAAELLKNADELVKQKIHPTSIIAGCFSSDRPNISPFLISGIRPDIGNPANIKPITGYPA